MNKKALAGLIGVGLGIVLLIMGITTSVPDRMLPSLVSRTEHRITGEEGSIQYVGGDAYNFLIESSIRGGEIAGTTAARAVYFTGGALAVTLGAIAFASELDRKETIETIQKEAITMVE